MKMDEADTQPEQQATATETETLAQLKSAKDTLVKAGLKAPQDLEARIKAMEKAGAKEESDPRSLLEAAARFVKSTAAEHERQEQKVKKIEETLAKARADSELAKARTASALEVHKEALTSYNKAMPHGSVPTQNQAEANAANQDPYQEAFCKLASDLSTKVTAGCGDKAVVDSITKALAPQEFLERLKLTFESIDQGERPRKAPALVSNSSGTQ